MATTKTTIGNAASKALSPDLEDTASAVSVESREEELIERENQLAAREARLKALEDKMLASMERLERLAQGKPSVEDEEEAPKVILDANGKPIPQLDLNMPHGTVIGDPDAGYVQNGHRFSKDRRYLCEEPAGVGKPFNLKMLGLIKVVAKAA